MNNAQLLIGPGKDFDTADHEILLQKVNYYEIKGIAKQWFRTCLRKKKFVPLRRTCSSIKEILNGVPQGSVLGSRHIISQMTLV